nr:3368_t:CDS:2 [Entrophospora candida]
MSIVNITNIKVLNNPALFTETYQFEITFECIAPLAEDLEWKIIYVGSSESEQYDQVLESIMVGPVPPGINQFIFEAPAPNVDQIPSKDILDVTVILITCSYKNQEFVRVGYYVNNEYVEEALREEPPEDVALDKLYRNILADKPRPQKKLRKNNNIHGIEVMNHQKEIVIVIIIIISNHTNGSGSSIRLTLCAQIHYSQQYIACRSYICCHLFQFVERIDKLSQKSSEKTQIQGSG